MSTTITTGTGPIAITIIVYAACYFLWKRGYRAYSIMLSMVGTWSLYYTIPIEYHILVYILIWTNFIIIFLHKDIIAKRFLAGSG